MADPIVFFKTKNVTLNHGTSARVRIDEQENLALERMAKKEKLPLDATLAMAVKQAAQNRGLLTNLFGQQRAQTVLHNFVPEDQRVQKAANVEDMNSILHSLMSNLNASKSDTLRIAVREAAVARGCWPTLTELAQEKRQSGTEGELLEAIRNASPDKKRRLLRLLNKT